MTESVKNKIRRLGSHFEDAEARQELMKLIKGCLKKNKRKDNDTGTTETVY